MRQSMNGWPRISVITPTLNQAPFIEETITSVLSQDYPDLEYLVIDGGSTDGTLDILKKYAGKLAYWTSEPDRGQAHAINKGLERATGRIAAYLNSDDLYLPGALRHVAEIYRKKRFDVFVGTRQRRRGGFRLRDRLRVLRRPFVFPFVVIENSRYEIPQECVFWNRARYGSLRFNEKYHFCLDVDWFCRIYPGARVVHSSREIGAFRRHPEGKTERLETLSREEIQRIVEGLKARVRLLSDRDVRVQRLYRAYYLSTALAILSRFLLLRRDPVFEYCHPVLPAVS
jgi:glycosyltransferase involved in cell wall biosynthesis